MPKYTYAYPRPALAVDCVIFGSSGRTVKVLLIKRKDAPFRGRWALPGGFVEKDENPDDAACREVAEETGVTGVPMEQFHCFGAPGRDPRGWVVGVAYVARVKLADVKVIAGDDASDAQWFPISRLPKLAFDHAKVFAMAKQRVQKKRR